MSDITDTAHLHEESTMRRFRARPWPVLLGSEACLRAKREATTGLKVVDHMDPVTDFEYFLATLETYIDVREWSKSTLPTCMRHKLQSRFKLFEETSWRSQMWSYTLLEGYDEEDEDEFVVDLVNGAFKDLEAIMCTASYTTVLAADKCACVRAVVVWLMKHDLDGLMFLLHQGLLHVGNDLFLPCPRTTSAIGKAESLLSLAAKDACSPAAVKMLLAYGANPNGKMTPRVSDSGMFQTCGPGGLACMDRTEKWCIGVNDKIEILTALAEAGGEMMNAVEEYLEAPDWTFRHAEHKAEYDVCDALWGAELARKTARGKQRFETVVALVGIISFWRRAAAAPDSKAAKAAIARAVKRARIG